ncbi:hypothetical protein V6N12_017617 [Hibiscus sabdariffa]|uniref:Uncharacterized protein n=1 Tax=Hibiscus sabdariffa TaxID=183260 RepID=A0ABR2CG25_9ROSI
MVTVACTSATLFLSISRAKCSPLHQFGHPCIIGDGTLVRFWYDNWVSDIGLFIHWKMNPALVNEDLLLCDVVMPKRFSELEPFKPPSSPDNSSVYHEHSRPRSCCGLQGLTVVLGVKGNMVRSR